ncbi:hypothetical protein ES703_99991 [subsurface metagenome]
MIYRWNSESTLIIEGENKMCTKQERILRILENNKGLMCPFKPILCEEGYCRECQIYLDWLKLEKKPKA